jgi:streptomycin 3"-adenylyltransferase
VTPWRSPEPDLALVISAALTADRPIVGPPPAEVLDPVPPADLRQAMLDGIPALLADLDGDEANVTLTFARIWVTVESGAIVPKDVAAARLTERVPSEHRPVLERARTIYLEGLGDVWDPDLRTRVRPCVEHLHHEIRRATSRVGPWP